MGKTTDWGLKAKIRNGEAITKTFSDGGLTFYPIKMSHYEEFLECKNAWAVRLSTLPFQYVQFDFLSALWALEYDSVTQSGTAVGLFERAIHFLYLTLRLEYKREEALQKIYTTRGEPRELRFVEVAQKDGHIVRLTPQDIAIHVRKTTALQNGVELPDESFNPELVAEEQKINAMHMEKLGLNVDTDVLISSVAYESGVSEEELNDWTVLRFERRVKAIERSKYFLLYGQAELSGMVKFPKGNPYPSWCYEKKEGLTPALRTMSEINDKVKTIGNAFQAVEKTKTQ